MKKMLFLSAVVCVIASSEARAQVSVGLNFGYPQPSYVVEPGPAYAVTPAYPAYYQNYGYRHHHWHDERRRHHEERHDRR